jgi:hypothetical protein
MWTPRFQGVSRFWLTYRDLAGRLTGVVIFDAPSLLLAGLQVGADGLDEGMRFSEGHELDGDSSALVPPDMIGRMLSREETASLIRRIEQGMPKKSTAPSVWRQTVSPVRRSAGSGRDDDAA